MIWVYPYFRKPPYEHMGKNTAFNSHGIMKTINIWRYHGGYESWDKTKQLIMMGRVDGNGGLHQQKWEYN